MNTRFQSARDFLSLSRAELTQIIKKGHPIDPTELEGWLYRGTSLGLPGWVDKLAWKTFAKAFHRDPETKALRGWNVKLRQGLGLEAVEALKKNDEPVCFGHFQVRLLESDNPLGIRDALILDYGLGGNPRLDPTALVRDPLVAIDKGNSDLLLGWTYLRIGPFRVGTPSFFVLERFEKLSYIAKGPRSP